MRGISRRIAITIIVSATTGTMLRVSGRRVSAAEDWNAALAEQTGDWINQVKVILTADKPKVTLEDMLVLDGTIRNDGPDPVYLFTRLEWGPGGGMTLMIRNDAGEALGGGDRILWPPPPENDPTLLVKLGSGRFYGARRRLDIKDFMSKPGKYSLQLKYLVPNSRASLGDKLSPLHILTHEEPALYSNKLNLEVVP